jgi:glycosyltransferase involved in cell wall biosynthesis
MKLSAVSFLIPAYRDEDTIRQVVGEADIVGKRISGNYEIIVINDASPDNTGRILEELKHKYPRLKVITHSHNLGYGGTIRDLYYSGKKDWMFTVPGDNQIPVSEIEKLIPASADADMVIGWRVNRHDPPARLRQSHVYNRLLRLLFGLNLHDVNSVRLMKSGMMQKITLSSPSAFVDAELAIQAIRKGFKVIETPIEHAARGDESTAGGGKLKTILPTIRDMVKFRLISN